MLPENFIWPKGVPWELLSRRVSSCMLASRALSPLMDDPKLRLHNYLTRICYEYGLHPAWVLVTLQRERSVLRGTAPTAMDYDRACGFVGSDAPGTLDTRWDGLVNQIWRCARHSSWYGGFAPKVAFGYQSGLWPTEPRWDGLWLGKPTVSLQNQAERHACKDVAEYVQLMYTDHLDVLPVNDRLYRQDVAPFF